MQSRLNPYLSFNGTAREAMEFYKDVFGGSLVLSTFKEGGMPSDPAEDNKIMHGMLEASNGMILMASDSPKGMDYRPGTTVSLSLSGDNEAELKGYWDKLSAGGTIRQPLEKAPWGDTFGMVADKFGMEWMVNISGHKA
jgi:PhnB protein